MFIQMAATLTPEANSPARVTTATTIRAAAIRRRTASDGFSGMPSAIAEVKRAGLWCVALDPRGEVYAWEFDFTQRVCIVVGSEGEGVHRLVKERCDARVRLPVAGHIASLNASAAASLDEGLEETLTLHRLGVFRELGTSFEDDECTGIHPCPC